MSKGCRSQSSQPPADLNDTVKRKLHNEKTTHFYWNLDAIACPEIIQDMLLLLILAKRPRTNFFQDIHLKETF